MGAQVVDQRLGSQRWLVVRGPRTEAFLALGRHAKADIERVLDELADLPTLTAHSRQVAAALHFEQVCGASERAYPAAWAELNAMAEGAGVDVRDLVLLTLRGDLGVKTRRTAASGDPATTDPTPTAGGDDGCSDFGWTDGTRAVIGHNEDGDSALAGRCALLTLLLDGEPAITTWWYPGFLPGNTFTVNEHGLVWGIDAINVVDPVVAPGRAFVARSVQGAQTLDDAIALLAARPSAGGFAYFMGKAGEARIVTVELAAGQSLHTENSAGPSCSWHTNHLRYLERSLDAASCNSLSRGETLEAVTVPRSPSARWVLEVLSAEPQPKGVRATGSTLTLCTLVVDLSAAEATLLPHPGVAVTLPLADLAAGDSSRAHTAAHTTG